MPERTPVPEYGPISPANAAALLTRSAERISKWEIFASPDRGKYELILLGCARKGKCREDVGGM
jgi:hypothetical protein